MNNNTLFCHLSSTRIAEMIRSSKHSVCYAGPGIQAEPADSMVKVAERLGAEMLTVCVDFDERVMRMGYGDIDAVKRLSRLQKFDLGRSLSFSLEDWKVIQLRKCPVNH